MHGHLLVCFALTWQSDLGAPVFVQCSQRFSRFDEIVSNVWECNVNIAIHDHVSFHAVALFRRAGEIHTFMAVSATFLDKALIKTYSFSFSQVILHQSVIFSALYLSHSSMTKMSRGGDFFMIKSGLS